MISTTTPLQIRNNPSNTSPSKQQWSFSKASRFTSSKSYCRSSFYTHRSCLSQRKASIGIGSRSKLFDGPQNVPQPSRYHIPTEFNNQNDKSRRKGFSFSANRDKLKFNNYLNTSRDTPNPTSYTIDLSQILASRKYSLRPKTAYPNNYFIPSQHESVVKKNLPGPGNYETIDCLGNSYRTKSPNHFAKTFVWGDRFKVKPSPTPGPQDYTNKTIEPDGIYLLSNMKSSGRRSFLKSRRETTMQSKKQMPGPGSYRLPSDFGHYQQSATTSEKNITKISNTKSTKF